MFHKDDFFERCHLSKNMFGQGEEAEELKAQECGPEVGRERLIQKSGAKGGRSAKTMVHPFREMAGTQSF